MVEKLEPIEAIIQKFEPIEQLAKRYLDIENKKEIERIEKEKEEKEAKIKIAKENHPKEIFDRMKTISFGDTSLPITDSYPELKNIPEILETDTLKLNEIKYQSGTYLRGIQIKFKDGVTSPFFQT